MNRSIITSVALALVLTACGAIGSSGNPEGTDETARSTVPAGAESVETTSTAAGVGARAESSTAAAESSERPSDSASPAPTIEAEDDRVEGTDDMIDDTTPPQSVEGPVIDNIPDSIMQLVYSEAESHTGMARAEMTVVKAQAVTWGDGSLGCPEPGMSYTQALVDGYWVELSMGNQTLDYRLSAQGGIRLCQSGGLSPVPSPDK